MRHELLKSEPEKLLWPIDAVTTLNFDAQRQRVAVQTGGDVLLSLGEVQTHRYTFQLALSQARWTFGIGVFWGFQEATYRGQACWQCQLVDLRPNLGSGRSRHPFHLWRSHLIIMREADNSLRLLPQPLCGAPVKVRLQQPLELYLTMGSAGLEHARWDGTDVPTLCLADANSRLNANDYQGKLGVFVCLSSGVFENARLQVSQ